MHPDFRKETKQSISSTTTTTTTLMKFPQQAEKKRTSTSVWTWTPMADPTGELL